MRGVIRIRPCQFGFDIGEVGEFVDKCWAVFIYNDFHILEETQAGAHTVFAFCARDSVYAL